MVEGIRNCDVIWTNFHSKQNTNSNDRGSKEKIDGGNDKPSGLFIILLSTGHDIADNDGQDNGNDEADEKHHLPIATAHLSL